MRKFLFLLFFTGIISLQFAFATENSSFRLSQHISIFNSVLRELELNYVDTLNYDKLMKATIDNMLSTIDPYTQYYPEDKTPEIKFMTSGEYNGIGGSIMKIDTNIYITDIYKNMPAHRNDLRIGDILLEIDGKDVSKMNVSDVSASLKGYPNSEITLKIKRIGIAAPIVKKFAREKITVESIPYAGLVAPKIGYVLLNDFTNHATTEFKQAVENLIAVHKIESLILDLRGNGGGLIDESVKILSLFLPLGSEVVSTKGNSFVSERRYRTTQEPLFSQLKLAILTSRSTASAAEIVAGAIQDLDRGIVIGERTFGKGLVQTTHALPYNGHLKLTIAKYYIPSGRCIQAIDFTHKKEDGGIDIKSKKQINTFQTKNGRIVKDGGGILPDTSIVQNLKLNISDYLLMQNYYFLYANEYVSTRSSIESPSTFKFSDNDYSHFAEFLKKRNFSYTSQTEKQYDKLFEAASYEGLDSVAKNEFEALKLKLKPDIDTSLEMNKNEIIDLISVEILKRYYLKSGEIEYALKSDNDTKLATTLLSDHTLYNRILHIEK